MPLGLYRVFKIKDFSKDVNSNPVKFSFCVETTVKACICVLLLDSCHVIVVSDKRQRLYMLEFAA